MYRRDSNGHWLTRTALWRTFRGRSTAMSAVWSRLRQGISDELLGLLKRNGIKTVPRPRTVISMCGGMWLLLREASRALVFSMPADGSVTVRFYRSQLHRQLFPVLKDLWALLGGDPLFQQDNAGKHTANLMLSFFEQYDIPPESHPPYSLDVNPNENAWVVLKRQVHIGYSCIGDFPGGPQKVKRDWQKFFLSVGRKFLPSSSRL